jgi:hypothetical protein
VGKRGPRVRVKETQDVHRRVVREHPPETARARPKLSVSRVRSNEVQSESTFLDTTTTSAAALLSWGTTRRESPRFRTDFAGTDMRPTDAHGVGWFLRIARPKMVGWERGQERR